jgi:hypothetical protein
MTKNRVLKESEIQKKIIDYLKQVPELWYFKTTGTGYGKNGVPDIIVCHKGFFIAFEVKVPDKGVVSELQKHEINKIRQSLGGAFVVTCVEKVKTVLDQCIYDCEHVPNWVKTISLINKYT